MKEKMISKIILVLTISVMLLAMPMDIFATSDGPTDLNGFWEDQSGDLVPENPTPEKQEPTTSTTPETSKPTTENQYAHAGVAEDTMMVIVVIALITLAVFANKKVNEYNNI